jgi:hypothetical protein
MNFNPSKLIPKGITRSAAKAVLQTKENSPHIFFGLGIAAVVGGTYLACKATLQAPDVLDAGKETIEKAKAESETFESQLDLKEGSDYDNVAEFESQMVMAKTYGGVALEVARLYAPAIIITGVGIACLTGSHVQLTRRNAALTMSLASLSKAFKEYRFRVRDVLGPDKEQDLYHGVETVKVHGPNGLEEVKVYTGNGRSPYSFCWNDANSSAWVHDAETNWMFVELMERRLNQRLNSHGYVFLSDVLDALGLEQTEESRVVGWILNSELGDGYISFGVSEMAPIDFIDPVEGCWFNFNVDGPIHTKALEKGGAL